MGDTEQGAIDALRAAGLEAEAHAVEQLRGRHKSALDAFQSAQRASYERGFSAAQDLERQAWSRVHHVLAKHGKHPGRTDDNLADVIDRALTSALSTAAEKRI